MPGYFDWYVEGGPIAARAHFNARALSVNSQSYAFATELISAYAVARERGIKKSRRGNVDWGPIPVSVRTPFRALVDGFEEMVTSCSAPKLAYAIRAARSIRNTDLINAVGLDEYMATPLGTISRVEYFPYLSLADFTPFLEDSDKESHVLLDPLPMNTLRVAGLTAFQQWLQDIGQAHAEPERIAALLSFHYGRDVWTASITAMAGWISASSAENKALWNTVCRLLDENRKLPMHSAGQELPSGILAFTAT